MVNGERVVRESSRLNRVLAFIIIITLNKTGRVKLINRLHLARPVKTARSDYSCTAVSPLPFALQMDNAAAKIFVNRRFADAARLLCSSNFTTILSLHLMIQFLWLLSLLQLLHETVMSQLMMNAGKQIKMMNAGKQITGTAPPQL